MVGFSVNSTIRAVRGCSSTPKSIFTWRAYVATVSGAPDAMCWRQQVAVVEVGEHVAVHDQEVLGQVVAASCSSGPIVPSGDSSMA